MKKIVLLGELGRKFGRVHRLDVRTHAEAIRALCVTLPGFEKQLATSHQHNVGFKVISGRSELEDASEIPYPIGGGVMKIVPVVMGSGAVGRIILGAALIAGAFFTGGLTLLPGLTLAGAMTSVGLALALGGVSQLLTKSPKDEEEVSTNGSFSGPVNTVAQGGAVPLCYGRMIIGSAVISAGIITNSGGNPAGSPLKSKAYASIIDLLCEGEIVGLVNGYKSIFLNETQVENDNGTRNFTSVFYDARVGTQNQAYMIGFLNVEAEQSVGTVVSSANPITQTITDPDVNRARVRVSIPALTSINDKGKVVGSRLELQVLLQSNGGGYNIVRRDTISGKATSKYDLSYNIDLTGSPPWDVRVRKVTDDATEDGHQNTLVYDSLVSIIDGKFTYPNSAVIGIVFESAQFSSVPSRAYDIKGRKIRIPSNASVRSDGSLTYSGSWDGTFQTAWTTNPAWIFYDIVTNTRFGLGNFVEESTVDKWALYQIGTYCDELVPTGFGGTEPRFSCNILINTRSEAFRVLNDLASTFRGMIYWSSGTLTTVQDAPSEPVYVFNQSNVVDGIFNYAGSAQKTRFTSCKVTWLDPDDFYRAKIENVEDQDGIARYGFFETEVIAIGCTTRGQAARVGRWLLYTSIYETETVSFSVGLEGAVCRPGQIIKIADASRAGTRLGGRVASSTSNTITTDSPVSQNIVNGTLYVQLPDGSLESKVVQSYDGAGLITIAGTFSTSPAPGAIWAVSTSDVEAQTFRVVAAVENDDGTYAITAIIHDPDKFDAVEEGLQLEERSISTLSDPPDAPENLAISESLYESESEVRVKVTFSWDSVENAIGYVVQYKIDDGNFIQLPETQGIDIEVLDAAPGVYTVEVYALSPIRKRSVSSTASREIYGKLAAPADVQNFSMVPLADRAELSWDKAEDLDVLVGGSVRIRWTPLTTGQAWKDAVDIVPALPGKATRVNSPLLAGTYLAKFVDSSGVSSETAALIVTTVPEALELNVIDTLTESPTFPGVKSSLEVSGDALSLTSAGLIDDVIDIDSITTWDWFGELASSGTYTFDDSTDLGAVYTSRVKAYIEVESFGITDFIDVRSGTVDDWLDIDGDRIDDVYAELYMRTTEDNPSGSPVWTDWKPFFVSEYRARAFQFQLRIRTDDTTHNIRVTALSVTIDMPDIVQTKSNLISSASGAVTVTYNNAFRVAPAVGITAYDMVSGDYYQITNASEEGFDIVFKNSLNAAVVRNFDVLAKGYGRKVA